MAGRTSASSASTGRSSPSSARSRPGSRSLVIVVQNAGDAIGGPGLARGRLRHLRRLPAMGRARAAARDGEGAAGVRAGARARVPAAARARDRRASRRTPRWTSPAGSRPSAARGSSPLNVLEVPLDRALAEALPELERTANRELDEAVAIGDSYGIKVLGGSSARAPPAPRSSREAERARRRDHRPRLTEESADRRTARVFGKTVDYVLKHAPCRVLVTASGGRVRLYSAAVVVFSVLFVAIGDRASRANGGRGRRGRRIPPRRPVHRSRRRPADLERRRRGP